MKILDAEFREAVRATIDSDGNIEIGGLPFTPLQVLEQDPAAYEEAFLLWRNEKWIPERTELLDEILVDKQNSQRFDELLDGIVGGRVIPFVGSGMSVPCGMPQWSDCLRGLCESSSFSVSTLEDLLQRGCFEEAASEIQRAIPAYLLDERLEQTFRARGPIAGAIRLLPEIFNGTVVTTNFDDILETTYREAEASFGQVLRGSAVERFRKLRAAGARCLVKIHGHHAEDEGRVLTAEEYDAVYSKRSAARNELSLLFSSEPLLFLGCSLKNDRTMTLLKEIVDNDRSTPRNYALMPLPVDATTRDREHFLAERKIFPIWYRGDHDQCIEALMVGVLKGTGKL